MKTIPLTRGMFALVDDEDFEYLNQFNWCAVKGKRTYYAETRSGGKLHRMHRVIMNAPDGIEVDHKNGNGLDNQKRNLRNATSYQNSLIGCFEKLDDAITARRNAEKQYFGEFARNWN